jgi:hypothetical protein
MRRGMGSRAPVAERIKYTTTDSGCQAPYSRAHTHTHTNTHTHTHTHTTKTARQHKEPLLGTQQHASHKEAEVFVAVVERSRDGRCSGYEWARH